MSGDPVGPDAKQDKANKSAISFALGAGTELVVSVLLGFLAGQWLDKKLGSGPWLMLGGAFLGITVGLYQLVRAAQKRLDRRP